VNLEQCRSAIDEIDMEILPLLQRRAELSRCIGKIKAGAGLPIADPDREDAVIFRVRDANGADENAVRIYGAILRESRRIQLAIVGDLATNPEGRK
jgi:chorismate mutase/prephenate dehydratase